MSKNIKCLITAGCSYSQYPNTDTTWPFHLNEWLQPEKVVYSGQGAAGNGIIRRHVVYNVIESLKTYKPEEILVGIVWSEHSRKEVYSKTNIPNAKNIFYGNQNYCTPVRIVDKNNYYLINPWWDDEFTINYKRFLYRKENTVLETIEHILAVQDFLKNLGIKYFMSKYDYDCMDEYPFNNQIIKGDKDLEFFYSLIDQSTWLPIENLYAWSKFESGFDFARPPDPHPSTEQQKAFTDRVIVPFLLENKMVYDILT